MTKASDNLFPSLLLVEQGSTPTSPAAGDQRLFIKTSDHLYYTVNSAGTVTAVGGGGAAAFSGVKAYHSTTQSISAGATASLNFDSEEFDTDSYHDNATNNTRLTVPSTAYYQFGCSAYNNGNANEMEMWFRKNGTTDIRGGILFIGSVDGNQGHFSTIISLSATDYIEVRCFLKATASVGNASASLASEFWAVRLGT